MRTRALIPDDLSQPRRGDETEARLRRTIDEALAELELPSEPDTDEHLRSSDES